MLESLEASEFSLFVRNDLWGWPLALTIHAFGTALVVGFILIIGLRLLGLFEQIPFTSVKKFFPVIWLALIVQIGSGFVLWMSKPTRYVVDGAFVFKVALILIGIIMTLSFRRLIGREAPQWEAKGLIAAPVGRFVAAMLIVWCGVVILGRLTGYLGAL